MISFDVPFIFDKLGGPSGVWTLIQKNWPDAKITYPTVHMWSQRGKISQPWQAPVIYLMHRVAGVNPLICMRDDGGHGGRGADDLP